MQDIFEELQKKSDIEPDEYDGSYELMRKTIEAYKSLEPDFSNLDYRDLNTVYLMSVGTWRHSVERKKVTIENSHLPDDKKKDLIKELDRIFECVKNTKYSHREDPQAKGQLHMGMFGTGFYSFQGKTDNDSAREFICMCVDIANMQDENEEEIYKRAEQVLTDKDFHGMRAASASMVLHCLKPKVFPILNGYSGKQGVYKALGLKLKKPTEISTYIENCGVIRDYRNDNFGFKNYRVFDELQRPQNEPEIKPKKPPTAEIEENEDKETRQLLDFQKNIILYGPPGTGKTYFTAYYAVAIIEGNDVDGMKKDEDYDDVKKRYNKYRTVERIAFTTFHQSYGYEEFVEGIKPILDDSKKGTTKLEYAIVPGVFRKFCEKAKGDQDKRYVFIIDEINRGNISKIFGELITLIEDSKRIGSGKQEEMELTLPYSKPIFGVPDNVYIIGTMNTADRSIALMDTALRRRFHFVEMMPDLDALSDVVVNGVNIHDMLKKINERIEFLYDREHMIGHSYFMPLAKENTMNLLASIFRNQIMPLLQEYFFEDYEKIRLVLGDNQKPKERPELQFVKEKKVNLQDMFGSNADVDNDKVIFEIQEEAFNKPDAYIGIYQQVG